MGRLAVILFLFFAASPALSQTLCLPEMRSEEPDLSKLNSLDSETREILALLPAKFVAFTFPTALVTERLQMADGAISEQPVELVDIVQTTTLDTRSFVKVYEQQVREHAQSQGLLTKGGCGTGTSLGGFSVTQGPNGTAIGNFSFTYEKWTCTRGFCCRGVKCRKCWWSTKLLSRTVDFRTEFRVVDVQGRLSIIAETRAVQSLTPIERFVASIGGLALAPISLLKGRDVMADSIDGIFDRVSSLIPSQSFSVPTNLTSESDDDASLVPPMGPDVSRSGFFLSTNELRLVNHIMDEQDRLDVALFCSRSVRTRVRQELASVIALLDSTKDDFPISHVVQPGESLWRIAARTYGSGYFHLALAEANPNAVNDGVLRSGTELRLPRFYQLMENVGTVRRGDSLWVIASRQYGDPKRTAALYEANRNRIGDDPNAIYPIQVLSFDPQAD